MKFLAINPDRVSPYTSILRTSLLVLAGLAATAALAQNTNGAHEYRADGETTIETVNGLRIITLRNNVFVRQNDVELTGDVAVLEYNASNQLQQVKLTGTPANFVQTPELNSADPISGNSDTINYYAGQESTVEFIGSANFNQPGTSLQCAQIKHMIETGATSGQACSGSLSPQAN